MYQGEEGESSSVQKAPLFSSFNRNSSPKNKHLYCGSPGQCSGCSMAMCNACVTKGNKNWYNGYLSLSQSLVSTHTRLFTRSTYRAVLQTFHFFFISLSAFPASTLPARPRQRVTSSQFLEPRDPGSCSHIHRSWREA